MSNILITGATGFIGSHLVKFLAKNDYHISAHGSSADSISKLKENLKTNNIGLENIKFWQQNFLDKEWDYPDFSDIETIIHCAAITKVREGTLENYNKYFNMNVLATKSLARKALEEKVKHFIYLSTGQVFGIPASFPITEATPKKPINLYGMTKFIGEQIVDSFGFFGLNYTIVRPFSIYGEGHYNIISIILDKLSNNEILTVFGDGIQTRAFLHISDFCRAIKLIHNNKECFNQEYNLSGIKEYSVNKLIQIISKKLNVDPKIEHQSSKVNELKRNIADLSKIRSLGFNLEETLEDFIEQLKLKLS